MSLILLADLDVRVSSLDELKGIVDEFASIVGQELGLIDDIDTYVDEHMKRVVIWFNVTKYIRANIVFELKSGKVSVLTGYSARDEVKTLANLFGEYLLQRDALQAILAEHPMARVGYKYDPDEEKLLITVDW